ncbi:MAG: MATE family efflux transporter [Candidatus Velthaea sp.]
MTLDHRDVGGTLARLAVPTFAATIGDQVLGIADTIVIGTFGSAALAAITGATTVFVTIVLTLNGLSEGAGILAAQAAGAGDFDRFGRITRASLLVPLGLACAIVAAAVWWGAPAMRALIGPLPTLDAGSRYFILRCCSIVPIVVSGTAYTVFAAAGDTRLGLKLLVWINVIHIPLLLCLALGWGTHHPLGLVGAGISSLCAETIGAAYAVFAARRRPQYRIFAARDIDLRLALRMARLGAPEAVYLFLVVAPDIAIVAILSPLGAQIVAAFRVIAIVSDLTWAIPGSLGSAAQTVIGQRFGAADIAGARFFERGAFRYAVALSTAGGIAVALLAWPIALACTLDARLAALAAGPLALHMLSLPLKGYAMVGIARIRAAGDTGFSMLVGIIAGAIALPGVWFALNVLHAGLFAVPLAWLVAWLFWCGATAVRLRHFDWSATRLAA